MATATSFALAPTRTVPERPRDVRMVLVVSLRRRALRTMVVTERILIVAPMDRAPLPLQPRNLRGRVPSLSRAEPACPCVWTGVVLRLRVFVNHSCAKVGPFIATLVATRIVVQQLKSVPPRATFCVPVGLVFPVLPSAILPRLVAPRIRTATALFATMEAASNSRLLAPPSLVRQTQKLRTKQLREPMRTMVAAVVKSCVPMVNVCPKVVNMLAKSSLLVHTSSTDGGTAVALAPPTDSRRSNHAFQVRQVPWFDVRMGGAVTPKWAMTVAQTTRRHGFTARTATVLMAPTIASGWQVGTRQHFLALIPRANGDRVVAYSQPHRACPARAFLMPQRSAMP